MLAASVPAKGSLPSKMHHPNPFYSWLKQQGFWVLASQQDRPLTHLLLDGGKLSVPDSALDEFNEKYAEYVLQVDLYVVECKPAAFKMFMDLDFKDAGALDEKAVGQVCRVIYSAYRSAHECAQPSSMVVCERTLPSGSAAADNKHGLHLVWPFWLGDRDIALAFRDHAVRQCRQQVTQGALPDLDWSSILDQAVYRGSGLRMVGSKKFNAPPYIYAPRSEYEPDGSVVDVANPWAAIRSWVKKTSIRSIAHAAPPAGAQEAAGGGGGPLLPAKRSFMDRLLSEQDEDGIIQRAYKGTRVSQSKITPEVRQQLQAIQAVLPVPYRKEACRITALYKYGKDQPTFVLATDSKFCLNLMKNKGRHNSNHVYFVLNSRKIVQKCFCQCETLAGRKSEAMCKDFVGKLRDFGVGMKRACPEYEQICALTA